MVRDRGSDRNRPAGAARPGAVVLKAARTRITVTVHKTDLSTPLLPIKCTVPVTPGTIA